MFEQNLNDPISTMNNVEKVCSIILISQVMEVFHAINIIHSDLKTKNIKIIDFGVTCIVECQTQS